MHKRCLFACLLAISSAVTLRADRATNASQLSELRALSFSSVRKVLVANLATPLQAKDAVFHGCAVRSEWKEVSAPEGHALAEILRQLIGDGISCYAKAGDDDVVWLQPLGFVYGEIGVRLETDRGEREFSIKRGEQTDYVYAYDAKKHALCFVVEGALQGKLNQTLPDTSARANAHDASLPNMALAHETASSTAVSAAHR